MDTSLTTLADPEQVELKYVYVPADTLSPIQELTYRGPDPQLGADSFVETLKSFFGQATCSGGVGGSADKEKLLAGLRHHAGAEAVGKLSEDMLNSILHSTQLDMFPVLMPTPASSQRGVTVYVDDKGVSKNLQRNDRLSRFAQDLGYANQVFIGDGFVGRVWDDEKGDVWRREDFTLAELSSDAAWTAVARDQVKNKKSAQDVADFKKQFLKTDHASVNMDNRKKLEDRVGQENNYAFRDAGDELELTFDLAVQNKRLVKVEYAKGGSELYVEYDGDELFGEEFFRTRGTVTTAEGEELKLEAVKDAAKSTAASGGTRKKGAKLFGRVEVEDCSWSLVDGKLVLTLMKKGTEQWPRITAE